MGRAQQASVNKEATTMLGNENATAGTAGAGALAGFQKEATNPGYTQPEQTAITGATEGGLGAAFGSAAEGAANRAARTNNSAGLTSTQDALARQRMITSGNIGAQNQETIANARIAGTGQANAGLAGIYGTATGGANATLGHQVQNASTPGFWDQMGGALSTGLGKGLGAWLSPGGVAGGSGDRGSYG